MHAVSTIRAIIIFKAIVVRATVTLFQLILKALCYLGTYLVGNCHFIGNDQMAIIVGLSKFSHILTISLFLLIRVIIVTTLYVT